MPSRSSPTGRTPPPKGRVALRQERNREALVKAGYRVISEKGIDAATMQEIAQRADVGAGTVYSYFKSKDELAVAVLERVMHNLAVRIERVTDTFSDPAQVYAFGVRSVIEAATGDMRWRQLLNRPEVIAEAMYRCMGPFAIRDLKNATSAGRLNAVNAELTWKMATYAIIGVSRAIVAPSGHGAKPVRPPGHPFRHIDGPYLQYGGQLPNKRLQQFLSGDRGSAGELDRGRPGKSHDNRVHRGARVAHAHPDRQPAQRSHRDESSPGGRVGAQGVQDGRR